MSQKVIINDKKKYSFSWPTGSKKYPQRELVIDKESGVKYIGFVRDSKGQNLFDNWYEKIQKPADSCNIRILLERAVQSDNTAILNQRQKISADLTGLPSDLLGVLNSFQGVIDYFGSLPTEVKRDFSNNVYEFVKRKGVISDSLREYYKKVQKPVLEPIKKEIEENIVNDSINNSEV